MNAHETLALWEAYYVIVGTSAGALTGLQFVVMALVAESELRTGTHELATFGTPTVFHFVATLLISAVLSAPWHAYVGAAIVLAILAIVGLAYAVIIARQAKRTTLYEPVLEDWIWHVILPLVAYLALGMGAALLPSYGESMLFVVAGCALLLLVVGIHNAWDTATYVAMRIRDERASREAPVAPPTTNPSSEFSPPAELP